ncbi:MAG: ribbon-helix-helix domain-containing protein [Chloroflexi bacterium]|nr:ribbon-helix-helix domain-containing protein [Chloroflexota bacterium]
MSEKRGGRRSRKVPFNCYLSVEQLDALDRVSENEGKPRAQLVREAVERYLAERDELPPEDIPAPTGKPRARGAGA